ncbi:site-2 protease family protein [Archangium sp.]|uniref:site-2 protease family protein n=1 Tax=Archangium sp. TaxID=1872627 RepID=UPI00389AE200
MNDPAPSSLPVAEEQPAPIAAAAPPEELEYQRAREAFLAPERPGNGGLLLVGTLALFVLSASREHNVRGLMVLVTVLLFHELGHWAGMRLFGFQDVKMFFIPFFGAAVSGRNRGAESWKEALVLLLGPVPGIILGCVVMGFSIATKSTLLGELGLMLLAINGFNLLPMVPLDGGRLFQLLLFSRHRYLELAFTLLTSLALVGVALAMNAWLLAAVGLFNVMGLGRQARLLRQVHALRSAQPEMSSEPSRLDDASTRALYHGALELVGTSGEHEAEAYKGRARAMRELHQRVPQRPPSALASVALSGLWLAAFVSLFIGLMMLAWAPKLGRPDSTPGTVSQPETP